VVARVKNQGARRAEIVEAAKRAIAERGLTGLRLKDVAAHSELTAGAVAYYYPDLEDLIREVHQHALDRFYWGRKRETERDEDPRITLRRTIRSGVPESAHDTDFQVLNELHVHAYRDPFHAQLMAELFDREVSLYVDVLEKGVAAGAFDLKASTLTVARNLVALEDAYGLHLLGGSHLGRGDIRDLILANAGVLTGCDLAAVRVPAR
jgi:AcrR family transcriptional regulator